MDYKTYIEESRFCECDYSKLKLIGDLRTMRLLHGALGLTAELLELQESNAKGDMVNTTLELGDIAWFAATICHACGHEPSKHSRRYSIADLRVEIEKVASAVKALVYYGRPLPDDFAFMAGQILVGARMVGINQLNTDPLPLNIKKLRTRYPEKFTEFAANNRDTAAEAAVVK